MMPKLTGYYTDGAFLGFGGTEWRVEHTSDMPKPGERPLNHDEFLWHDTVWRKVYKVPRRPFLNADKHNEFFSPSKDDD